MIRKGASSELTLRIIRQAQGIGFSVPSNTAVWIVSQLLKYGKIRRGYLGVAGQQRPLSRQLVRYFGLANQFGVELLNVERESPAKASGLMTGDIIVAVDGKTVQSIDEVHRILTDWQGEASIKLTVIRLNEKLEFKVTPIAI